MRRRDEAAKRPKRLKRRNAPMAAGRRSSLAASNETNVARLTRERDEAREQQTATADVLKVISRSAFNLQTVLDTLVESAARLCSADSASIHRPQGEAYPCIASYGLSPEFQQYLRDHPIARGRGSVLGRVVSEGKTIHVPDVLADAEHALVEQRTLGGYRTILGVPLRREGEAIGLIRLTRNKVQPFTNKQIELVTTFADQAVIAIENTRLLNELRESLQQQTATSEVLKVISSSPGELEPVFNAMLASATRICEAKFGILWLCEEGGFRCVALHNAPPAFAEERQRHPVVHPPLGSGLRQLADTKQVAQVADMKAVQPYLERHPFVVASVDLGGYRTVLNVPMLKEDELIGAISIFRAEVRPFIEKQIELVQNFAAQAVIAIENTRLLNELRQRTDDLSESLEQQTATSEVLQVISSSPGELEPVFNAMLANATRICEATSGNLFLREGTVFRSVAAHSKHAESWRRNPVIDLRDNPGIPLDRIAKTKQVVHIPDLQIDQSYLKKNDRIATLVEAAGARTHLSVPMLKDGELVGAIGMYRQEVRPFTDKQIKLVQNFASQAVIAIENTRLLNELRDSLEQQTATSEVLKVISSSPGDLEPVFNAMLENATRICEATFGNLFLREGSNLRAVAVHGKKTYADSWQRNPIIDLSDNSGVPLDRLANTKQITHVPDLRMEQSYLKKNVRMTNLVDVAGARTYLAVPMLKEDNLVGAIGLYREEVRPFSQNQIDLVQNFAAQAVIAIENARLLSELRQRTTDLSKSLEDLRTTQDRLVQTQKLASLGQLTAGIAHEIKNPLNFVNNFSVVSAELINELQDILKRVSVDDKTGAEIKELTETLQGNLDKVVQHGKRADAIVKNMLLHSREGSGEHRLVDINALVEESLNLAYHGARAEKQGFNITLERSFDPAAGQADVFPQDITRVLLNLISNGFYAATKRKAEADSDGYEPTLVASTRSLGDWVEIRVRDNGTGIPPDVKEKMFNPFFTTKPAGEGTGLGLSISHDVIVKQHGGTIEVETQPGEYAEFRIILPRAAVFLGART
jgi:two-component system, NtrC family, sensor kinase